MNLLTMVILGFVQGITEFLPVSSSGHLALLRFMFHIKENALAIDVAFHFGTFFSIILYYRKLLIQTFKDGMKIKELKKNPLIHILIGIIPAGIAGVLGNKILEQYCSNSPALISVLLIVTGTFLFSSRFIVNNGNRPMTIRKALFIGIFQIFALLPGISRAGTTITTALHLGISRTEAASFSFLMAAPLLLGAAMIQLPGLKNLSSQQWLILSTGMLVAFLSGLFAIKLVLKALSSQYFQHFSWYCWTIGIVTFIFL